MKKVFYKTFGTCSQYIEVVANEHKVIQEVHVIGGCNGNLKGICTLIQGMTTDEVKAKLKGIRCGNKSTSCPDQLCYALEELEKQY